MTCLQFNSKFVITSSDDGTVKLWDVKTGELVKGRYKKVHLTLMCSVVVCGPSLWPLATKHFVEVSEASLANVQQAILT